MPKISSKKTVLIFSVIAWSLLIPAVGQTRPISVGGTMIEVPDPPGFAAVTPQMAALFQFTKQFVAPTNEEFFSHIPESEVQKALNDEMPELGRRFSVQTAKSLLAVSASTSDFLKLKQTTKTQNDELFKKIEKQLPGLLENANKGITEQTGLDAALSISQVVPLPAHEETIRTVAYSLFAKVGARDEAGKPVSTMFTCTATYVHVKAKILFLYAYAEESGLEWSRTVSKQWADSILAANPPDAQSSAKEALPTATRGINWDKVAQRGVIGAVIGAMIGLGAWIKHRITGKTGDNKDTGDVVRRRQNEGPIDQDKRR